MDLEQLDTSLRGEDLIKAVVDHYERRLFESNEAVKYLKDRLVDQETAKTWRLGLSDRTLGLCLPKRQNVKGKALRDDLLRLNLYRQSGHEFFVGSIVLPVFSKEGRIAGMFGLKLKKSGNFEAEAYLSFEEGAIFNVNEALSHGERLIISSNPFEALVFMGAGFKNVVSLDWNNLKASVLQLTKRCEGSTELIVAVSSTNAGDRIYSEVSSMWKGPMKRVTWPAGEGVIEVVAASSNKAEAVSSYLQSAIRIETTPDETDEVLEYENKPLAGIESDRDGDIRVTSGVLRLRARGVHHSRHMETLTANVMVTSLDSGVFHLDTFDLYSAKARSAFSKAAAIELKVKDDAIKEGLISLISEIDDSESKTKEKPVHSRAQMEDHTQIMDLAI